MTKNNDVWRCGCGYSSFKVQRDGKIACWTCGKDNAPEIWASATHTGRAATGEVGYVSRGDAKD